MASLAAVLGGNQLLPLVAGMAASALPSVVGERAAQEPRPVDAELLEGEEAEMHPHDQDQAHDEDHGDHDSSDGDH